MVQYTEFLLHFLKLSPPSTKIFSSAIPLFKHPYKKVSHPFCPSENYRYVCGIDNAHIRLWSYSLLTFTDPSLRSEWQRPHDFSSADFSLCSRKLRRWRRFFITMRCKSNYSSLLITIRVKRKFIRVIRAIRFQSWVVNLFFKFSLIYATTSQSSANLERLKNSRRMVHS